MNDTIAVENFRETNETLSRLGQKGFPRLRFGDALEARFEQDTRKARSFRMWREGFAAILLLNACLVLDYCIVKDAAWATIVLRTAVVTPLALAVNMLMLRNPARWLREGSVAFAVVGMCWINLYAQGNGSETTTGFGIVCLMIMAMFGGVVMRLRFGYAASSIGMMLTAGAWYITRAHGLALSAKVCGVSMTVIALAIILMAGYSLEREERTAYLLCAQRDQQAHELEDANDELKRLSTVDKLTGLPNRRALEESFEAMWAECSASGQALSAVMIDIDHFKRINDLYGHLYGDEALRRLGALLPQALRSPMDLPARFGGEEFVILLPNADGEIAATVAERVRQLVETAGTPIPAEASGEMPLWTTVSCGVASCVPSAGLNREQLLENADQALYAAKRAGRNCVEVREYRLPGPVAVADARKTAVTMPELRAS